MASKGVRQRDSVVANCSLRGHANIACFISLKVSCPKDQATQRMVPRNRVRGRRVPILSWQREVGSILCGGSFSG